MKIICLVKEKMPYDRFYNYEQISISKSDIIKLALQKAREKHDIDTVIKFDKITDINMDY